MAGRRQRLFAVRGDRPIVRSLLLMGVFMLTATAFWWHFERRMAHLTPPQAAQFLHDASGVLPVDEVRALHQWRDSFKQALGLDVLVLVSPDAVEVPAFAQGTLFVGVGLARPEAVIVLPPLARKAMGEGPRLRVEEDLVYCLADQAAKPSAAGCLQQTLRALWQELGGQ